MHDHRAVPSLAALYDVVMAGAGPIGLVDFEEAQELWSAVIARREDLPKNFEPDRRYCLRASATASDG
jgi:hypothetical protein